MADDKGKEVGLQKLFAKLGHSVEEIRVRSLQNILSKLEYNLLCDADLIQEKHLHTRLLEWFNFPSAPKQQEVLDLILRLTKHSSAAEIYLDIGAVQFLTELRQNVDLIFQKTIDAILDQLFHLPTVETQLHNPECIYKPLHDVSELGPSVNDGEPELLHSIDYSYNLSTHSPGSYPHRVFKQSMQYPSSDESASYFVNPADTSRHINFIQGQPGSGCSAKCFRLTTFPWGALTSTDRHILLSTDDSLRGNDASMVVGICEFLTDVVFQDFPAEVFLQRPKILQSLLSVLSLTGVESVSVKAASTLIDLTQNISVRVHFHQDPAVFSSKHDQLIPTTSSSSSSVSPASRRSGNSENSSFVGEARHRGDGQELDSSSGSTASYAQSHGGGYADIIEQTDLEDIHTLQFDQWTISQYCVNVLDRLMPCLNSTNGQVLLTGLQLCQEVLELLKQILVPEVLWSDDSFPAKEFIDRFHDILEGLGEVVLSHHHSNLSSNISDSLKVQHRIAFMGLASFTIHLLEVVVPLENDVVAIPKEFVSVLSVIFQDRGLSYSFPDIADSALNYCINLDPDACSSYYQIEEICASLASTCQFISKFQDITESTALDLVVLAERSIPSLQFHQSTSLIEHCIQLASFVSKQIAPDPVCIEKSACVVLTLLSYPINAVRLCAYGTMLKIITGALDVNEAANPSSTASLRALFVIDTRILHQICCFGMADINEIQVSCQKILQLLLQSQLILTGNKWQRFLNAILPILPALQCWCNIRPQPGNQIINMLETNCSITHDAIPIVERMRGCLRLMLHSDASVRLEGSQRAFKMLSYEEECLRKLPALSDVNISALADIFMVKVPRQIKHDERRSGSVFQASDVRKVYDILTSDTVETSVRKSALEQLAIILLDDTLHQAFIDLNGINTLISLLHAGIRTDNSNRASSMTLLPTVLKALRSIVQTNSFLRRSLAKESTLYATIFRCAIVHSRDETCRKDAAELLTFLLFNEGASENIWSASLSKDSQESEFSVPACVAKRYSLPFKCSIQASESPWMVRLPAEPDEAGRALRSECMSLAWNIAWHDGIGALLSDKSKATDTSLSDSLFSEHLQLSPDLRLLLATSFVPHSLQHCRYDIENATSHNIVSAALLQISLYIACTKGTKAQQDLQNINWRDSIARFLMIIPSTIADEQLLFDIIQFLRLTMSQSDCATHHDDVLQWLTNVLLHPKGALQAVLARSETTAEKKGIPEAAKSVKRLLNRALLQFVKIFVGKFPYNLSDCKTTSMCVHGDLVKHVLSRIGRADQSYNLPSLELTLQALTEITARPGWSLRSTTSDSLSLCIQMLQSLLEVLTAFHIGRGGLSMSYMGCGITRCAAICLRHLAYEMTTQLHSQDWPRNWLFFRQASGDSVGESGLHWLFPLWSYRDVEVRVAGVGIATALTSTESGRITMTTQCHNIPGGIWGTALSLLLDDTECSLVRQQAALLLVNLTSQPLPTGEEQSSDLIWRGPVVMNEETQVSLVGLPALLVLVHHTQFYDKIRQMLSNYYVYPSIHPPNLSQDSQDMMETGRWNLDHASQATLTTSGSNTPVASEAGTVTDVHNIQTRSRETSAHNSINQSPSVVSGSALHSNPPNSAAAVLRGRQPGSRQHQRAVAVALSRQLSADDQSQDSISHHSSLTDDGSPQYTRSVVTPCLVSGLTQLLSNLINLEPIDSFTSIIKEGTVSSFLQLCDVRHLDGVISLEQQFDCTVHYRAAILDLLTMHRDIASLVQLCATQNDALRRQLLADRRSLKKIVLLLGITYSDDPDIAIMCIALWESVLSLLCNLFVTNGQEAYQSLQDILVKYWNIIGGRVISIQQDKTLFDSDLWMISLNLLALLFTEESKHRESLPSDGLLTVAGILDSTLTEGNEPVTNGLTSKGTGGDLLCQALVHSFDSVVLKPQEQYMNAKTAVISALKSLLAHSMSAKTAALEAGLMETLCEHIQRLNSRLEGETLEQFKSSTAKKKISNILTELVMIVDLLTNFLHDSEDVKISGCKNNLAGLMHCIWTWVQIESSLMLSVLNLLCNYTARCPQACSSLAYTCVPILNQDKTAVKSQLSSNSLVHCLIKLLQKELSMGGNAIQILRPAFTLASTFCLSQECRGILWKSNFLHEFSSVYPKRSRKKEKGSHLIHGLWLNLLTNLSFSSEGQNMILKIDDSLLLLIDFGFCGMEGLQRSALLILRNLCFQSANKPKLLANEQLIPLLMKSLEFGSNEMKTITCSALLCLLYNNHKAKGVLKNTSVLRKLQDSYNQFTEARDIEWAENCAKVLKDVLVILEA